MSTCYTCEGSGTICDECDSPAVADFFCWACVEYDRCEDCGSEHEEAHRIERENAPDPQQGKLPMTEKKP